MLLFRIARTSVGRILTGWLFAHMSFAIPVQRLRETKSLVAFHHPKPSYPIHILIVAKRAISTLLAMTPADNDFILDLIPTVQSLVTEFQLEQAGYRLIVNGGHYQDVGQLHFHLVSGQPIDTVKES
jgi:histidine triad (HIT) family protein